MCGSTRTRILRIKRIFTDWLCVLQFLLPLTKVFWKGEFEGKNLFFKKGFPLLAKRLILLETKIERPTGAIYGRRAAARTGSPPTGLEKTSTIGSQLAGDRMFFQGERLANKKARVPLTLPSRNLIFNSACANSSFSFPPIISLRSLW